MNTNWSSNVFTFITLKTMSGTGDVMVSLIFFALLIFFIQFGIGGGLYETLVMYPRWRHDVTPANLQQKLADSGQLLANKRYWPIVSPIQALLSVINIALAWQNTSDARTFWLAAALIILLVKIVTFAYFAPTMVRKFQHPENLDADKIQSSVNTWLSLSRWRTVAELAAWILAIYAVFLLR